MKYLSPKFLILSLSLLVVMGSLQDLYAQLYDDNFGQEDSFQEPMMMNDVTPSQVAADISDIEVVDLNEINMQEAQMSWENIQKPAGADVTRNIRIDEIVEPSSDYRYSAFGKPDPFKRPSLAQLAARRTEPQRAENVLGSEIPMISPLQAFPLDDLEVKGVWGFNTGENRAIIMTPRKEGIVVKVGDPISAGKILSITREKLVVRQYRIRDDGVREFEDLEMIIGTNNQERQGIIRLNPGQDPEFVTFDERGNPVGRNVRDNRGGQNAAGDPVAAPPAVPAAAPPAVPGGPPRAVPAAPPGMPAAGRR